jgi:hypothetical protein
MVLTIGIIALVALLAAGLLRSVSTISARRQQKWREIARERRRKEEARIARYRQRLALMDAS